MAETRKLTSKRYAIFFVPLAVAAVIYSLSLQLPSVSALGWTLLDQFIQERAQDQSASQNIVVLDIDDNSLNALAPVVGKWPWPRAVHAEIIEYLEREQVQAIVFDILFSEPDLYRPDADAFFVETIAQSKNVFFGFATQAVDAPGLPYIASYPNQLGLNRSDSALPDARAQFLLPTVIPTELWKAGHIDLLAARDGLVRQHTVQRDISGWHIPSLPKVLTEYLGYPLDQQAFYIDWKSKHTRAHQTYSYAEVLADARGQSQLLPPQLFRDKIVLIGASATGLHDLHATPIDHFHPGVHILATSIDNILTGSQLTLLEGPMLHIVTLLLLITLSMLFYKDLTRQATITGLFFCACLFLASWQMSIQAYLFDALPSIFASVTLMTTALIMRYVEHQKALSSTLQTFSRFMDPTIVQQLVKAEDPRSLFDTKSVEVTVLFSDIRNFTTLSETRTPGEVINLLNHYFDSQVKTLFKHQATLDKFIGDAIMAFWGAPLDHEQHPVLAISAALDMVENLSQFIEEYGYEGFDIGIGIHTGKAVVGLVGSHDRYDYTAIGDTVNLASRIEGLTKDCAHILVSESTMEVAKGYFEFVPKGEFKVKGRSQAVKVYEPKRLSADTTNIMS